MPDDLVWHAAAGPVVATSFGKLHGWDVAIVVPAKDEESRIAACLDASAASLQLAGVAGGLILVVNDSIDATAAVARRRFGGLGLDGAVIDCRLPLGEAGVGRARALGLEPALKAVRPGGALMTTDADSRVRPEWVAANLDELRRADLICGAVLPASDEALRLPPGIWRHGPTEGAYMQASVAAAALLDPVDHDPATTHRNPAGASLAFQPALYRAVGGMPLLSTREDRAFVARAEAQDWRVRYSESAVVETSCRLTGRSEGGMAGALRARRDEPDPYCDEWLEPARATLLRNGLRGALRRAWPDGDRIAAQLDTWLGPRAGAAPPCTGHFGAFWLRIEAGHPALARRRLRQSDAVRELPRLQTALDGLRGAWSGADALTAAQV